MSECLMRILRQTVNAYYRKEYAVTVIVLSTQWEDIICKKLMIMGERQQRQQRSIFLSFLHEMVTR